MVWRNAEHYPDPTAGAALRRMAREEATNEMNEGKRFERDFQASVPPDACGTAPSATTAAAGPRASGSRRAISATLYSTAPRRSTCWNSRPSARPARR